MSKRILFILFAVCLWNTGCDIINPEESIPTYVHIDSFKFINTNPDLTGTGRQKINSVWAYIDGETVGVFDLPATIPVLLNSKKQLQLAPGVDNQGLKDYKLIYPFFSFYTIDLEPKPGEVIQLQPETQYLADLKYWKVDFESGNAFSKLSGDTSIRWVSGADSVFEGGKSGIISLDETYRSAESFAPISFIPGSQSYLELHYKGNLNFQVGILATLPSTIEYSYLAGIKAGDAWGKFYLDIRQYTSRYPSALKFSVIIKSSVDQDNVGPGYVLLDNIKVISY